MRDAAKLVGLAWFAIAANHEVGARAAELWERAHWLGLGAFAGIWLAALAALLAVAFSASARVRTFWSVPIAASALLGNWAYTITGHHLAFYDVVLYANEQAHWGDALLLYSNRLWPGLFGSGMGLLALCAPPRRTLVRARGMALAPILPTALIAALVVAASGKGTRALPEQFAPLAMLALAAVERPFESTGPRETVKSPPENAPLAENVFLVIDESVRADFLDPNGARGVTPGLLRHAERFANFGYAVSGNNCSLFSNLMLRYGGTRETVSQRLASGPSIWAWAHAAGFETVFIDAQLAGGRLQNGMTLGERGEIDRFVQLGDAPLFERDTEAARQLAALARDGRRTFALLDKWGSHFPYARNYPPDAAPFQPAMAPEEPIGADRERLLNAYRNSLRWTTDGFFEVLLAADLGASVVVYTSDHGQNLLDHGVLTQCNSSDPHVLEGVVPLLVLSGIPALHERFALAASRDLDRASHFEIFPTLLELLGYAPARGAANYGPSLLAPRAGSGERAFTYGPVVGVRAPLWLSVPADVRALALASSGLR